LAKPDKDPHRLLASDQRQDDSIMYAVQTFHLASFEILRVAPLPIFPNYDLLIPAHARS